MGRIAALNVANFAEQADKMVREARARASEVLALANFQADQAISSAQAKEVEAEQRGHDEGFRRGYAEGQTKGQADGAADGAERAFNEAMETFNQQTDQLRILLQQSVEKIDLAREEILQQARGDLLELSLTIAEKIVHTQTRGDIAVAKASLAKAIEMVSCSSKVQARVCPDQLEQLQAYAGEFLADMGRSDSVAFIGDRSLSPGDVVLQSAGGQVDARVQTQIDKVVGAVTGRTKEGA